MVYGAPITYASFGEPVAPGQLSMHALLDQFRVTELRSTTRFYAVAGENVYTSPALEAMNREIRMRQLDALCIPLETSDLEELLLVLDDLRIDGVQLEGPLARAAAKKISRGHLGMSASAFLDVSSKRGIRRQSNTQERT